jgi:hypothetical protein
MNNTRVKIIYATERSSKDFNEVKMVALKKELQAADVATIGQAVS